MTADINRDSWDNFVEGLMDTVLPAAVKTVTKRPVARLTAREAAPSVVARAEGRSAAAPRPAPASRIPAFDEANPGLREFLVEAGKWSDFARSLANQIAASGSLSERQIAAAQSMRAKCVARNEARAAAPKAAAVDLAPVRAMFETAAGNGYQKPTYRAEGLVINRAPMHGANPGALYVKSEGGDYLGKVIGTEFKPVRGGEAALEALGTIAADPLNAALRYGQRTGRCACCGRELTNHASIDLGIGPICREKWGL